MSTSIIDPAVGKLTSRERFRRLMHYQPVDRIVHWEFGYLAETVARWHQEGLRADLAGDETVEAYFGVEPHPYVPINTGLIPGFAGSTEVLEELADSRIVRLADGTVQEVQKEGRTTIPRFIKMPIADRDDWKRYKERLDPAHPDRWRTDWRKIGAELNQSDNPVGIGLGSYLGIPRNWIGFENIGLMCYDDRPLVAEIVATLAELQYTQLEAALAHCKVDFAGGWEDICFRNGPMVSPDMFRELVFPHLKRVCDLLRAHGCDVIWTDCDGDINHLVPVWLDAGLNCMFPIEVHSGSDPVALRKKYGRQILLVGGLAKYEFAKGKREIIAELKRVEQLVADGGYIPHGDHRIPDDVPYDNYRYYIREKLNMLGWPAAEIAAMESLQGV